MLTPINSAEHAAWVAEDLAETVRLLAEWNALTAEQQADIIADQDAAAYCDAADRAEMALSPGYGS